ncbi:MAG: S9 family peptidase [Gemmatimonadaceae bacterium]
MHVAARPSLRGIARSASRESMHRSTTKSPTLALLLGCLLGGSAPSVEAQTQPSRRLTVEGIFGRGEFSEMPMPVVHWLKDGVSYLELRRNTNGGADLIRVHVASGTVSVLADASKIVDERGSRIAVEEIQLSADETKALLFHSSVRVWRSNTRGIYHVIDFASGMIRPIAVMPTTTGAVRERPDTLGAPQLGRAPSFLAPGVPTDLQMFAKFSPDGRRVAFVRDNDLFVTDLATCGVTECTTQRVTHDGSAEIINGTTDWVYEEELGLRDAFRWSPDSKRLAYWRFDQSHVPAFPIVNETAGQYPSVGTVRYPKAGAPNSSVKVGVVDLASLRTTWLDVGADTGIYIARMEWVGADSLAVQRLPRKQNQVDVLMLSAATGRGRRVLTDRDAAYVDVEGEALTWLDGGQRFLWRSDRSGWRQFYLYDRSGALIRQITHDGADALELLGVDERTTSAYVLAAAPSAIERQVYRYSLSGAGDGVRVSVEPGAHAWSIAPGSRYAVDYHSRAGAPSTASLVELPRARLVRTLADNARLRARLDSAHLRTPAFFKVPMPDGTLLDAYRITPTGFDSTHRYPTLMYVYGGPAAPEVVNRWGGRRYLWHQSLAEDGYVVVCVDNRGAAWRGNAFRKVTQYRLGLTESQDQIDAAKWLGRQPWVDPTRIGLWGWSYGGYLTALTTARGGDVFRAAISVAPVSDWHLYDTIYTERYMWLPRENPDGYRASSPQTYVSGLAARLLLVHGTGDDNVHLQNSIQLSEKLIEAKKPFYEMFYPNRTHSIAGGNAQAHLFGMMTQFLDEHLKPLRTVDAPAPR